MRALPILAAILASVASAASAQSFSHDDWTVVLEKVVDERGFVDYRALAADRATFDRYLASLRATSPDSAAETFPTDGERLAYWLNAYNAWVFQGVLARGGDRGEIRSVWGEGWLGLGFFKEQRVVLGGRTTSLQALEDDVVRGRFHDPRVHAALNCASRGCPRLPRRAFEGGDLDAELDRAMREFVAEPRNLTIDLAHRTVRLSKIFDWFEDDFLGFERRARNLHPSVVDYVNRYRAAEAQVPAGLEVVFLAYDKALNDRR